MGDDFSKIHDLLNKVVDQDIEWGWTKSLK